MPRQIDDCAKHTRRLKALGVTTVFNMIRMAFGGTLGPTHHRVRLPGRLFRGSVIPTFHRGAVYTEPAAPLVLR